MTEFGRDLQRLLRAAELETDATSDDRARMRRRLAKRLGAAAITASTAASVSGHASAGATIKVGAWLAKGAKLATVLHGVPLALAIGATAAVPLVHAVRATSSAPIAATIAPERTTHADARPSPPAVTLSEIPLVAAERSELPAKAPPVTHPNKTMPERFVPPAPSATAVHVAPSANEPLREVRPSDSEDQGTLLEEYALISRMHRALGAHDRGALMRAIDEHRRRFASGVLAEEREAMSAMLECMQASTPEQARAIASKFEERHPRSLHTARVEASCADRTRWMASSGGPF